MQRDKVQPVTLLFRNRPSSRERGLTLRSAPSATRLATPCATHLATPCAVGVTRDPMQGQRRRSPWNPPFRDAGGCGRDFVRGSLHHCLPFGENEMTVDNPHLSEVQGWWQHGVRLEDILPHAKGAPGGLPHLEHVFEQTVIPDHVKPEHVERVSEEVQKLENEDAWCVGKHTPNQSEKKTVAAVV